MALVGGAQILVERVQSSGRRHQHNVSPGGRHFAEFQPGDRTQFAFADVKDLRNQTGRGIHVNAMDCYGSLCLVSKYHSVHIATAIQWQIIGQLIGSGER